MIKPSEGLLCILEVSVKIPSGRSSLLLLESHPDLVLDGVNTQKVEV